MFESQIAELERPTKHETRNALIDKTFKVLDIVGGKFESDKATKILKLIVESEKQAFLQAEEEVKKKVEEVLRDINYLINSGHDVPRKSSCFACDVLIELKGRIGQIFSDNQSQELKIEGKPMIPPTPKTSGKVTSVTPDTNTPPQNQKHKDELSCCCKSKVTYGLSNEHNCFEPECSECRKSCNTFLKDNSEEKALKGETS